MLWNERAKHAFHRAGFRPVRAVHRGGYDFVLMDIRAEEFDTPRAGDGMSQPRPTQRYFF